MPMPSTLVGIIVMAILVGYVSGYAYNPQQGDDIRQFQNDMVDSMNNATSSDNPIYAIVGIGSASLSTFALALSSVNTLIAVYVTELPADYYIISVVFGIGLVFGIIRYIRGMWDR